MYTIAEVYINICILSRIFTVRMVFFNIFVIRNTFFHYYKIILDTYEKTPPSSVHSKSILLIRYHLCEAMSCLECFFKLDDLTKPT